MKYSVFTLAFPGYKIEEVLCISSKIGLDGIDIRVKDDEHIPVDLPWEKRKKLLEHATSLGLVFSGVYGYVGNKLVDPDTKARNQEIELIKAHVRLAKDIQAGYIRLHPGTSERTEQNIERFVKSCRKVAQYALAKGIVIGLENHGELAHGARLCRRLVEEIGLDNVRIIFDPANLQRYGLDPVEEGRRMWEYVICVHIKDWRWKDKASGKVNAVPVGQGEVNIDGVINLIKEKDYEGWICLEYEKKWHPELPDPERGLVESLNYVKAAL